MRAQRGTGGLELSDCRGLRTQVGRERGMALKGIIAKGTGKLKERSRRLKGGRKEEQR